jgi:hypothetical protein
MNKNKAKKQNVPQMAFFQWLYWIWCVPLDEPVRPIVSIGSHSLD